MREGHKLTEIRAEPDAESALVFIHGFKGDVDDTWGLFPTLLGTELALADWNILSLGYNTSLLPGTRGIWSADPDLPILGLQLRTRLGIAPLLGYRRIALIAHSMGGLVAQRALVDDPRLAERIRYLFLFGTPSAGLTKAGILARLLGPLFGQQVHNMARDGQFISGLRTAWTRTYGTPSEVDPPFGLYVVAGDRDQFVPPDASLEPFAPRFQRVVSGDHLAIVKPRDRNSESVQLVLAALSATPEPTKMSSPLRLAAEQATPQMAPSLVAASEGSELSQAEVVEMALALDRAGQRARSIQLLTAHLHLGTDVHGTYAGRLKRRWLQEGNADDAKTAMGHYQSALSTAIAAKDHEQIYYLAINVAFMKFLATDDLTAAQEFAHIALASAIQSPREYWRVATEAEAHVYLNQYDQALELYQQALAMDVPNWKLLSAAFQAQHIAAKLGQLSLQESLRVIFDAEPPRRNRIFVSYSHRDKALLDEFRVMITPLLKQGEMELWDDTGLKPGARWDDEIKTALASCRIALLLVSAEFLASEYVNKYELPVLLDAADRGEVSVLWVLLSPALYEETRLRDYQAAYSVDAPLAALPETTRRQAWKEIAGRVKQATFD